MDGDAELKREMQDLGLGHPSFRGEDRSDDPTTEWTANGYLLVHARTEEEAKRQIDLLAGLFSEMLNSLGVPASFTLIHGYPEEC